MHFQNCRGVDDDRQSGQKWDGRWAPINKDQVTTDAGSQFWFFTFREPRSVFVLKMRDTLLWLSSTLWVTLWVSSRVRVYFGIMTLVNLMIG